MPLQVGELMILRGCAWMSRKRIFSSSRWIARCVWSRPVCLPSACPRLDRHVAVGLGREHAAPLRRRRCRSRSSACRGSRPRRVTRPFSSPSCFTSVCVFQRDALAAVADLVHQRAERGEALVDVRVVALDDLHVRRGLAGDQLALAALPVLHVEGLRQLGRACRASAASAPARCSTPRWPTQTSLNFFAKPL